MRSMVEGSTASDRPHHHDASRRGPPPRSGEDFNSHAHLPAEFAGHRRKITGSAAEKSRGAPLKIAGSLAAG